MSIAVGLGLSDFPFSGGNSFWRWVDMCETSGVDSIWQTDRLVSRHPILECITTMAALAGATKRIKFGMNVVSVSLRDPLLLAKQCATIDVLSEGRLLPAFGVGNSRGPEWDAVSLNTKGRGRRTNGRPGVPGRREPRPRLLGTGGGESARSGTRCETTGMSWSPRQQRVSIEFYGHCRIMLQ